MAFAGMVVLRGARPTLLSWLLCAAVALPFVGASLYLVLRSIPLGSPQGTSTFSVVATAVLIAGLAAEEFIGRDVRALFTTRRGSSER